MYHVAEDGRIYLGAGYAVEIFDAIAYTDCV